jgi:hypothetical protein
LIVIVLVLALMVGEEFEDEDDYWEGFPDVITPQTSSCSERLSKAPCMDFL